MPAPKIFDRTFAVLQRALDLRSMQHRILAANIANMDTPNYKAFELVMDEALKASDGSREEIGLVRTHAGHLPGRMDAADTVRLKRADPPEFSLRGDGNTVDIDKTMGQLAENTLMYKIAAQLISKKFTQLKSVIQGGK